MDIRQGSGSSIVLNLEPLDYYQQTLEETRFLKRHDTFARRLARETHFDEFEVQNLILIYHRIVLPAKRTRRMMIYSDIVSILTDTFDMTDEEMTDKVVATLDRKTGGQRISKTVWVKMLSLFFRGSLEERIRFCFSVYDSRKVGFLGREALFGYLKSAFFSPDGKADEESTRDMIDILMKKMDLDRDGKISLNDYRQAVLRQPCMLEFLGQCLPDRRVCLKFATTWRPNVESNQN